MKIHEKMGDISADVGLYRTAIKYYHKMASIHGDIKRWHWNLLDLFLGFKLRHLFVAYLTCGFLVQETLWESMFYFNFFQLECGYNCGKCESELIPAYISLAQTYLDDRQYESAIKYFKKELECRHGEPAQVNLFVKSTGLAIYDQSHEAKSKMLQHFQYSDSE